MRPFAYARPGTLDETFALLARYGPDAKLLAGGTDLVAQMRIGRAKPHVVVDLKRVTGLSSRVVEVDSRLRIGALAIMTDLIGDERVGRHFPALVESARVVGSVQIRNRATLAGNICNASPAADTAPTMLAYGAIVNLIGTGGIRSVPLAEFFIGPGRTALRGAEIVESIDLPIPSTPTGAAFGRVTRRRGVDLATINLCCVTQANGEARFAFGAAGPRPFVVKDDSGVLIDAATSPAKRDAVLQRLIEHAHPISDVRGGADYRRAMLMVMSRRALRTALDRMQSNGVNG